MIWTLLSPKLWIGIVLVALLAGSHWIAYVDGKNAVTAEWDKAKVIQLEAQAKAVEAARVTEQGWQTKVTEAQRDSNTRAKKLQTSVNIARSHADGLRGDNATLSASIPFLTRDALERLGIASGVILDQCVREYLNVAKAADGLGSERQTLIEAWPKK